MSVKIENFEFSSDIKNMSEGDFKALLKARYGITSKRSKELYKQIHGDNSAVPKKDKQHK